MDAEVGLTPRANFYARLYWKDLQSLAGLDSHWIVELAGNDIMAFFTELATDFAHVDVTELRAQKLSVQIPPPGFSPAPRQHHAEEPLEMDDLPSVFPLHWRAGFHVVLWLRLPLLLLTSYASFASFANMILMIYRSFSHTSTPTSHKLLNRSMEGWSAKRQEERSQHGPSAKMRALSPQDEQLKKAVLLVSKMTLRQKLEVRELQSAVFKTFMLKKTKPAHHCCKE